MLTLGQWKETRRVDHVDLGIAAVRFRGASVALTDLKIYDADVAAYPSAANDFDRVTVLGRILEQTRSYLGLPAGTVPQRYARAVDALRNAASQDLNRICGTRYQPLRTADLMQMARRGALSPKTIAINVLYLAPVGAAPNVGPIDAIINGHIAQANACAGFMRAGLSVARSSAVAVVATQTAAGESILNPVSPAVPVAKQGRLAEGGEGGRRLIRYCNALAAAPGSVDVVYADHFDQDDVQGRTYRAGSESLGIAPNRPIVAITLNPPAGGAATYATTLAHELGHALTGCPDHSTDPANLMCGGGSRSGSNQLSDGQVAWLRNNAWVG